MCDISVTNQSLSTLSRLQSCQIYQTSDKYTDKSVNKNFLVNSFNKNQKKCQTVRLF